jgi:hypothetical protein
MKKLIAIILILLASVCSADYLGSWNIDDYVTITVNTHRFSTGAAYAATGDVDIWIYEDDTDVQIVDTTAAAFDSVTGLYLVKVQLTAAAGFEAGKCYTVLKQATVDSIAGTSTDRFQIMAAADVRAVGGGTQSATDLKDLADTGYDPATHKVQGVVLADTITTYTGNTLQTGDSFARIGAAGAGLTNIDLPNQTMDITGNLSGSVGSLTGHTAQTGDSFARLGAPVGASISADIAAVKDETAAIVEDTATIDMPGEIATAVWNALTNSYGTAGTYGEKVESLSAGGDATAANQTTIINYLSSGTYGLAALETLVDDLEAYWLDVIEDDAGTNRFTTNALEQAPTGGAAGSGLNEFVYVLADDATDAKIVNAKVWVTSDVAGVTVVATGYTNQSGSVTFYLDSGTAYIWRYHPSYTFTNPDPETIP